MKPGKKQIKSIIDLALAEDIGNGDITSEATIPASANGRFVFAARQDMVVCGIFILDIIFAGLKCRKLVHDGQRVKAKTRLFSVEGSVRKILSRERVALNFMQHLSGVSTLTRKFVDQVNGTGVKILDTRKTTPGLRVLEKYAVTLGGGINHRMRLDDGILIKDNHIAASGSIEAAINGAKKTKSKQTIIVECDTLRQVQQALKAGAGRLLLDNMSLAELKKAVSLVGGKIQLEASGGINLANVKKVAKTGVDFISVGALTHSAPSVDIGLDEEK